MIFSALELLKLQDYTKAIVSETIEVMSISLFVLYIAIKALDLAIWYLRKKYDS